MKTDIIPCQACKDIKQFQRKTHDGFVEISEQFKCGLSITYRSMASIQTMKPLKRFYEQRQLKSIYDG